MRVLVTGAAGFVGYATVRRLLHEGHHVTAISRSRGTTAPRPVKGVGSPVWLSGDIGDTAFVRSAIKDVDAVVHLAALTRVRDSFDHPDEYAQVNVGGTTNLLDAIAEAGRPVAFVHSSTAVVYGTPDQQPISEACPPAPSSPYGQTKLAADLAIQTAAQSGAIGGVSLRGFNISGAVDRRGDRDLTRIIPKAVAVASGRFEELTVNGDGTAIRDFVHVADTADAIALALAHARTGHFDVYNLGATPATVAEIIDTVEKVTERTLPVRHNPPAPEAPELRAETALIRRELGWEPSRSTLEQIITDAWSAELDL